MNRRLAAGVRTGLIAYGLAAYAYIVYQVDSGDAPAVPGGSASARWFLAAGLLLQLGLYVARAVLRRHAPDRAAVARGFETLDVLGDGATVLLFALATLGTVTRRVGGL